MEQNQRQQYNFICLHNLIFFTKNQKRHREKTVSSKMVLVKMHRFLCKNENRYISITLHKTQLHIDQGLQQRPNTLNLIEQEVGNKLEVTSTGKDLQNKNTNSTGKRPTLINGSHEIEKLLQRKEDHHLNKVAAYRIGEVFIKRTNNMALLIVWGRAQLIMGGATPALLIL